MTQTANHVENTDITCGGEEHANQDFSFQLHLSGFVGVVRLRFEQNFSRSLWWTCVALLWSLGLCWFRITKSGLPDGAVRRIISIVIRSRDTVTKSSAGDCAFRAARTTGSITGARSGRKIERSKTRNIGDLVGFPSAFDAVGITEAPCLNLCRRQICRGFRRASCRETSGSNFGLRRSWSGHWWRWLRLLGFDFYFRRFHFHDFWRFRWLWRLHNHRLYWWWSNQRLYRFWCRCRRQPVGRYFENRLRWWRRWSNQYRRVFEVDSISENERYQQQH